MHKLGGERRQPLVLSLRPSVLDGDVLAFYIAQLAQPLPEGCEVGRAIGGRGAQEEADPGDLRRCLSCGRERRGEEASSHSADERPPADHWIISSARKSSDGGI